jgi:hypothetical protein
MQQERNPVADYIADHAEQLATMAAGAGLEALAGILRMAQLEARFAAGLIPVSPACSDGCLR